MAHLLVRGSQGAEVQRLLLQLQRLKSMHAKDKIPVKVKVVAKCPIRILKLPLRKREWQWIKLVKLIPVKDITNVKDWAAVKAPKNLYSG